MNSQVLTEAQLLTQLPAYSRIVSPSQRVFIRQTDGVWWNWANGASTGAYLQPTHDLPAGSRAFLPNESVRPCYVKHANGNWLKVETSSGASASDSLPPLQILPQTTFRNGATPVDDSVVLFGNVPMSAAARGQVPDPTSPAFTVGNLVTQEKATIRFGLPYLEQTDYRPRQHNLQRFEAPIMRGHLAMEIAKEVRRVIDELEEVGRPLTAPGSSQPVTFDELILVDIRRVSRGSLQPTLAVRGA